MAINDNEKISTGTNGQSRNEKDDKNKKDFSRTFAMLFLTAVSFVLSKLGTLLVDANTTRRWVDFPGEYVYSSNNLWGTIGAILHAGGVIFMVIGAILTVMMLIMDITDYNR